MSLLGDGRSSTMEAKIVPPGRRPGRSEVTWNQQYGPQPQNHNHRLARQRSFQSHLGSIQWNRFGETLLFAHFQLLAQASAHSVSRRLLPNSYWSSTKLGLPSNETIQYYGHV